MEAEATIEVLGRQNQRLRITGTLTDEFGAGISGGTLTVKTLTIYDVASDTVLLDHDAGTIAVDGAGVMDFWIGSDSMTVVDASGTLTSERHRALMEFAIATPNRKFNVEFDILVKKVKHLA